MLLSNSQHRVVLGKAIFSDGEKIMNALIQTVLVLWHMEISIVAASTNSTAAQQSSIVTALSLESDGSSSIKTDRKLYQLIPAMVIKR